MRTTLIIMLALFAIGSIAHAGGLEPSAAPAPTMKTLVEIEPRIPISQADIPKTISAPGSYYLTENVNISAAGIAITVDANDVTIDLAGFVLSGSGPGSGTSYGIYMSGRSNVEIRNGTVRDFRYGIIEVNASGQNHRVINARSISNGRYGIYLAGSGHLVKNCTASDNGDSAGNNVTGIWLSSGCTVTGNTVYDNGTLAGIVVGIQLGAYNLVDQNTTHSNGIGAASASNMNTSFGGVFGNNVAP